MFDIIKRKISAKRISGSEIERCFEKIASTRPKDAANALNAMLIRKEKEARIKNIWNHCSRELRYQEKPIEDVLNKAELQELKDIWGEVYDLGVIDPNWAALYKEKTGEFYPDIIGNDIHIYFTEDTFVDKSYIRGLCDKNIMPLVTPIVKHPKTIISKLANIYLDENYNHISEEEAVQYLLERRSEGAVIKQCRSSGGKGVVFVSNNTTENEIKEALTETPYVNVQDVITQHPDMAKLNPSSVNTVRIITIILDGEVIVLSSVVRIGSVGSKVDNFHAGGMSCGISENGSLNRFASSVDGERFEVHDNGFRFIEGHIPNFAKVCDMAKRLHYCLPVFGVISWDFCIDLEGDPVLIEYNVGGGITLHQLNNGPLYGEHRQKIMEKIFEKYALRGATLDFSYKIQQGVASITKGSIEGEHIRIPEFIEDKPISRIETKAFSANHRLKSIDICGNLDLIGYLAFYKCTSLETVDISGSVKTIGRSAFNGCNSLREVSVGNGTREIGIYAFAECNMLKKIYIPNSVESIAKNAFFHSSNVKIVCNKGSYAEEYAKENNIQYDIKTC